MRGEEQDLIGQAVRMLNEHGRRITPVAQQLQERLRQDRELQSTILGEEMPEDPEHARRLEHRIIDHVYDVVERAMEQINPSR